MHINSFLERPLLADKSSYCSCSSRSRRMVMVIDLSSFLSVHFGRTIKSFGMIIPPVKHLLVNIVIIISIAYSNFDFCNHCYDIKYSYTGLTLI